MKRIKTELTYTVPHWNFCNSDILSMDGEVTSQKCTFCVKTKEGYRCMLRDEPLSSKGKMIHKTTSCCRATAGYKEPAVAPDPQAQTGPKVDPQQIIKYALDSYSKTVNELLNQGYPQQLADKVARDYVLGKSK